MYKEFLSIFQAHKDAPHAEVEFRIGKHNGSMFDTNVGKENFDRILRGLMKYREWEDIKNENTEVFYQDSTGLRISIDEHGNRKNIKKVSLQKKDVKTTNMPYDVRFSVCQELPARENNEEMDRQRVKQRQSFIRKNLSIDMTVVKGDVDDMDAEDDVQYQVEFEIIDPTKVKSENEFINIVEKINDVFKLLPSNK